MVIVKMVNVIADLASLVKIVLSEHAHPTAMIGVNASTTPANARPDTQDLTVDSSHALRSAPETGTATMELAIASLGSQEFIVPFQLVRLLVLGMVNVFLLELKWLASVMRVTRVMTVQKRLAPMTALVTESASRESAPVKTDGVVLIVPDVVLVMANVAVATVNVLKENVIVTLVGLVTLVTSELVCTIVHNMGTVTTERVSARKDTVGVTVLFLQNPSLVSAPSIASVAVSNSALKFTKRKELDLLMSATPNALKNVFHSVLRERCQ